MAERPDLACGAQNSGVVEQRQVPPLKSRMWKPTGDKVWWW